MLQTRHYKNKHGTLVKVSPYRGPGNKTVTRAYKMLNISATR